MDEKKTKGKRTFSLLFRLFLGVLAVVSFQNLRFFILAFICFILLLADLMGTVRPVRYKLLLLASDLSILALLLVIMYNFSVNNTIEDLRFKMWERQYEAAAEEVLSVLEEMEDTEWDNHKIKIFPPLALGREVQYRKHGDSIAVYFSTFHSFFMNGGFIYFSDEAIEEYFGGRSNFKEGWAESADASYDYVKPYNENWAYIILY